MRRNDIIAIAEEAELNARRFHGAGNHAASCEFRDIAKRLRKLCAPRVARIGTRAQAVLSHGGKGPFVTAEIASLLNTTSGAAARLLIQMRQSGYIRRVGPGSGRGVPARYAIVEL